MMNPQVRVIDPTGEVFTFASGADAIKALTEGAEPDRRAAMLLFEDYPEALQEALENGDKGMIDGAIVATKVVNLSSDKVKLFDSEKDTNAYSGVLSLAKGQIEGDAYFLPLHVGLTVAHGTDFEVDAKNIGNEELAGFRHAEIDAPIPQFDPAAAETQVVTDIYHHAVDELVANGTHFGALESGVMSLKQSGGAGTIFDELTLAKFRTFGTGKKGVIPVQNPRLLHPGKTITWEIELRNKAGLPGSEADATTRTILTGAMYGIWFKAA